MKYTPDSENWGGATSFLIGIGGALAIAHYLDTIGHTSTDGEATALVFLGLIAFFLLFVPCCIFWMLVFKILGIKED